MARQYRFISQFRTGARLPEFAPDAVKNEPMLFNCDRPAARALGGPITAAFLGRLPDGDCVIDTRVHMLMPGWFPCIPGFHHDDVPRTRADGQPNYDAPEYHAEHIMALVGGDICPTEFAVGDCIMPEIGPGEGPIYKHWHARVESLIAAGELRREPVPDRHLIWFDSAAFHQGVRATGAGWRWFARASFKTARVPTNEIRRQVQVYLEAPMEGW